ncbi:hypothetical protein F4802DRAFT_616416 [Xylaria palmicola]|nr:hypothetical protein F4802DRAFT_616416 [Xylaria palmicola]
MRPTRPHPTRPVPSRRIPWLRDETSPADAPPALRARARRTRRPPPPPRHRRRRRGAEDASVYFIGNATTIIEWQGVELNAAAAPGPDDPGCATTTNTVMLSSLDDFRAEVRRGWADRVVYLDRGEQFRFRVRGVM